MKVVAAKRSPILGYNHNVRFRGIVFHVQTEDSGIVNPHVFSHLFHGGVIISTRKLVYDPSATEETVKALMQSQHKAVMKDLKHGTFDDKIDSYLVGTPGLLPRGAGGAGEKAPDETQPTGKIDADEVSPSAGPPPTPVPAAIVSESSEPIIEFIDAGPTVPVPVVYDVLPAPMHGAIDAPIARAPTERVGADMAAAIDSVGQAPVATELGRGDISEAMNAIQVGDDELAAAGLVEVADVAQVYSPALPSTPLPPGAQPERPGQYSVVKRGSGPIDQVGGNRPPIPRPAPTPPNNKLPTHGPLPSRTATPTSSPQRAASPSSSPSRPATPTPSPPRAPAAGPGPIARPTPPAVPRLNPPNSTGDGAVPGGIVPPTTRSPAAHPIPRPATSPPRARPPSGGVVVSRPPVIVGGPSKAVGTPAGQGKVRRAKDTDGGIGGDLISERSLDEVILAYLSEDTNDD